jgi:dGTPase
VSYLQKVSHILEEREESLSPHAQKSRLSKGRRVFEAPSPLRTEFQRDRDRILHSKSFRRLKHKTQVLIAPAGDHYRTRLTHTLEVSQIARTIARALNLNEDLTEAISLGHDLGHTPFGHVGEDVLNELFKDGFHHNEQSLRIVDLLENDGKGLNLTWEVRDGIVRHSKSRSRVLGKEWGTVGTLEGEIVKLADMVAYINHDIDDAIRAGIITEASLPKAAIRVLGTSHSQRINTMVSDIIEFSAAASGLTAVKAGEPVVIGMSSKVRRATDTLRNFLFDAVYNVQSARKESEKARLLLRNLYAYFIKHTEELPPEYRLHGRTKNRWVIDYIAGMTDLYAQKIAQERSLLNDKVAQ